MYSLYLLKKSDKSVIDKMLADDVIGRQALTQKDAASFGLQEDRTLLLYEGSQDGNSRLKELFGSFIEQLEEEKAAEVYQKIKDEESQAEGGMGFIFGQGP